MLRLREQLEAAIEEAILALDILDGDADLEARCDDDANSGDEEPDCRDYPTQPQPWHAAPDRLRA